MSTQWERFNQYYLRYPDLQFSLDISRIHFGDDLFTKMAGVIEKAFRAMDDLEKGAEANPDEHRMAGHYWLRAPGLAPTDALRHEVEDTNKAISEFVRKADSGEITAANGEPFR